MTVLASFCMAIVQDLVEHYRSNSLHSVFKEVTTALLYPFKQSEGLHFYQLPFILVS